MSDLLDNMNESPRSRGLIVLGTLAILALYIAHALVLGYVVDDAYISFHYAKHLAQGHGLVYNIGERVEGYTNFLWVVLLAGVARLWPHVSMLHAAWVMGLGFGILTILLLVRFSVARNPSAGALNLVAPLLLACNSSFAAWTTGGLESTMFTLAVLVMIVLFEHELRTARGGWAAALSAAVASLVRADGFVLFAILSAWRLWDTWRTRQRMLRAANVVWFVTFALVFGSFVAWRLSYYGAPLPNTSYAKVGLSFPVIQRGLVYAKNFCAWYGAMLVLPMMLLPFLRARREAWLRCTLFVVAMWTCYVVTVGGDGLAFYRFFGFVAPLIGLLVQQGVLYLYECLHATSGDLAPRRVRYGGTAWVVLLAALGAQESFGVLRYGDENIGSYRCFDNYFIDRCRAAGEWLAAHSPADSVVASTPAGAVAYFSDRRIIDMLGLTDRHIARATVPNAGRGRAGHECGDGKYVLARKPVYILLGNVAVWPKPMSDEDIERTLCQRSEHEIWANPAFHRDYERVCVKLCDSGLFQYFTFYQRRK